MTSHQMTAPEVYSHPDIELSVIIISYNTSQMTYDCVKSVLEQSSPDTTEVIVIDNNSNDDTIPRLASSFPAITIISNKTNTGFACANNQGLQICKGRFVLLLNSDTIVLSDVMQKSIGYLKNQHSVGGMGCRILNPDLTVQRSCSGYPTLWRLLVKTLSLDRIPGVPSLDRYLLRKWKRDTERNVEVISGCYLMIRREVIHQAGLFDEDFFFFGEEVDWCLRIRQKDWQLCFAPVGNIIHYGGGSVKTFNHQRDIMLTSALVRIHKKNSGILAAITAYFILMLFNISRALWWSLYSLFAKSARNKALHFLRVVQSYRQCWPT